MPAYSAIDDVADLTGKVFIVTGANSGLGYEATRAFLRKGAVVVMACRNPKKAQDALDELARDESLPSNAIENARFMPLDLADQKSVKSFAAEFMASFEQLDVLLNNAGLMQDKRRTTVDGFEVTMGVNHLAHYTLTALLMPVLENTAGSRIVSVSSGMHSLDGFDVEDLMFDKAGRKFSKWTAYAYSKLCNLLFTFELAKRLKASGKSVMAVACHPGYTVSPIHGGWSMALAKTAGMTPEKGALSLVFASVDPSMSAGQYIGPDMLWGFMGTPVLSQPSHQVDDKKRQSRLWELSEKLTGVPFDLEAPTKRASASKRASSKRASARRSSKSAEARVSSRRQSKSSVKSGAVEASSSTEKSSKKSSRRGSVRGMIAISMVSMFD